MNELIELQHQLQNYLLFTDNAIAEKIVSTEKAPRDIRLGIYGKGYRLRLLEVFESNYPILHQLLGDDDFGTIANEYLDQYPSTFPSIRWFGDQLANFLKTHTDYCIHPYLAELALLEWTMGLIFDAKDQSPINTDAIMVIPHDAWGEMQLIVHPSTHRLNFAWNTVAIWQALSEKQEPPEFHRLPQLEHWILWRKELNSLICLLPEDEAWAIDALLRHQTFGEICEGLCQWATKQDAGMRAASLLKGWISAELIVSCAVGTRTQSTDMSQN